MIGKVIACGLVGCIVALLAFSEVHTLALVATAFALLVLIDQTFWKGQ